MADTHPERLSYWDQNHLEQFLRLRQKLFLDPLGSNRKRFEEAAVMLQRALFAWYFSKPGEFLGLLSWVQQYADTTRRLRQEEARDYRRTPLCDELADSRDSRYRK